MTLFMNPHDVKNAGCPKKNDLFFLIDNIYVEVQTCFFFLSCFFLLGSSF